MNVRTRPAYVLDHVSVAHVNEDGKVQLRTRGFSAQALIKHLGPDTFVREDNFFAAREGTATGPLPVLSEEGAWFNDAGQQVTTWAPLDAQLVLLLPHSGLVKHLGLDAFVVNEHLNAACRLIVAGDYP